MIKLIKSKEIKSALVFTRTKRGANKVVIDLQQAGIGAEPIHANKSQSARERALNDFKLKRIKVLVATDIASRGIDVNAIEYVFNFDLPEVPETYIHRIGRTGRAGLSGISISFCAEEEKHLLEQIIKHIKLKPEVVI